MPNVNVTKIEKVAKETIKFFQDLYDGECVRFRKKIAGNNLEKVMYDFHTFLDARTKEFLKKHFSAFMWMDHWNLEKIGMGQPEIFVVANTSDGTSDSMKGLIGGHVSALAFLPPEARTMDKTIFSIIKNYETNHLIIANNKGKLRMEGFRLFKDVKKLENASVSVELGNSQERKTVLKKLNKILTKARDVGKHGCLSLNLVYTALRGVNSHIDIRKNCSDISHFPPSYLILKNLGGALTDTKGKDMAKYDLRAREQVPFIASSNKIIHNQILRNL